MYKQTRAGHRSLRRPVALVAAVALLAGGCAGNTAKYKDTAIGMGGAGESAPTGEDDLGGGELLGEGGATGSDAGAAATGSTGGTSGPRSDGAAGGSAGGSSGGGEGGGAGGGGDGKGGGVGVTPTQVTLGLFYPQTAHYAAFGVNAPKVVQAAFNEVNEQGGIHGRKLAMKTYDEGSGNAGVISANHQRARNESMAFMSILSETNEALAEHVERDKVPFVIGNISGELAKTMRYGFSVMPYWSEQATILPSFIANRFDGRGKRIAIVYEGTSSAKKAKDVFKSRAASHGLNVVFEQPIDVRQSTCVNEVSNLQSRDIDIVYMQNGPLGALCMLRDARTVGFKPIWTSVGATWNLNIVAQGAGGAAEGLRTLGSLTTLETPAGRHFSAVMQKYYPNSGAEKDDVMLLLYGMVRFYIEVLRRTGPNLTRETFVQTAETKMSGFDSGYMPPPQFGPGDRTGAKTVNVTECQGDRWVTVEPTWRASF